MDKISVRQKIIFFIESYNNSDLREMEKLLDDGVIYKDIAGDIVNVCTKGKKDFLDLNKKSFSLFTEKEKSLITISTGQQKTIAEIFFDGVLAQNMGENLLKGDRIRIETNTEFTFSDKSGLIVEITDYSS